MLKKKVLDKGHVALLNVSGPIRRPNAMFDADDTDPAKSARISFDKREDNRDREKDLKLNKYLIENGHNTPLEMIEVWLEMRLPIFVARQFVRHRTACINEVSARYVTLPADWYLPEVVGGAPENAKQGQSDTLHPESQEHFNEMLNTQCESSYNDYLYSISRGVAPEHARLLLHVNHYTKWVWKQDLHNLSHFLRQRSHPHAQVEAQAYANAITELLREALPELTEQLLGE